MTAPDLTAVADLLAQSARDHAAAHPKGTSLAEFYEAQAATVAAYLAAQQPSDGFEMLFEQQEQIAALGAQITELAAGLVAAKGYLATVAEHHIACLHEGERSEFHEEVMAFCGLSFEPGPWGWERTFGHAELHHGLCDARQWADEVWNDAQPGSSAEDDADPVLQQLRAGRDAAIAGVHGRRLDTLNDRELRRALFGGE